MTNPSDTSELGIGSGAAVQWLLECAKYFEQLPPALEDAAHWAHSANANTARRIADLIASMPPNDDPDTIDRLTKGEVVCAHENHSHPAHRWELACLHCGVFRGSDLYVSPREGHVEVPVEPTEAMLKAMGDAFFDAAVGHVAGDLANVNEPFRRFYRAMLAAANQGETKP